MARRIIISMVLALALALALLPASGRAAQYTLTDGALMGTIRTGINDNFTELYGLPSYSITGTQITNWDAAFGWGNHALAGYLTSYTELDPVFSIHAAAGITGIQISNWDAAFGWGNHALAGYLTSYTELDPVFSIHAAAGITGTQITNWDTAYGWGNHALAGYLTSYTETDPVFSIHAAAGITGTQITNWDTAYGWGNHALAGYLTSFTETDPVFLIHAAAGITGTQITNWDTAYSWGNHALAGYLTSYTETDPTAEPALGNPAADGYVLSSTAAGVRSWVVQSGGALALDDLTDTTITTPVSGQVVKFNGTAWVNAADDTGSGSVPSGTAVNDILQWDGTDWIAQSQINGLIDDLAGNGDINSVWSADKIFDSLALKEASLGNPSTDGYVLSSTAAGVRSWIAAGSGSGDMLKSVYDTNADGLIDDAAIAATIARDSEIPTAVSQLTNDSGYLTSYTETDPTVNALATATLTCASGQVAKWNGSVWACADDAGGSTISWGAITGTLSDQTDLNTALGGKEASLGNPSTDGYVLSSTAAGVRSWVAGGGSVDLTAPGPIGTVTPNEAHFTTLTASSFDWGTPPTGETGELQLLEDPTNGTNSVTVKAPASIAADVTWVLPSTDGTVGQSLATDGAGTLSWITPLRVSNNLSELTATVATARANLGLTIGTNVQAYDADLADLADGSLTGSKVGTGISATNVTTGTLPDAVIPSAITRDTEMTPAPVTAPTTATDTCTAGTWAYDSSYHYICIAADTWVRAALVTW